MRRAGVRQPRLDLNHPGVGRALVDADPALAEAADAVFELLSAKDAPGLAALCAECGARADGLDVLRALTTLYGDLTVLDRARECLPDLPAVRAALDDLRTLCAALPDAPIALDLADMGAARKPFRVMVAIFGGWHDLVRGGRYGAIGRRLGGARAATGFSLDLRELSAGLPDAQRAQAIRAPWSDDPALAEAIRALRAQGRIVIQALPGEPQCPDEFFVDQDWPPPATAGRCGPWTALPEGGARRTLSPMV
ncbi:ATP phosphoribosyltransferase regulatory subunit OS=Castellaniella defragrans (strain DSM /CCUG 39792 / 65Phen) OX=1437824 GN=hisZ PE=3 SV=1 [Castellaniella denitrificans]